MKGRNSNNLAPINNENIVRDLEEGDHKVDSDIIDDETYQQATHTSEIENDRGRSKSHASKPIKYKRARRARNLSLRLKDNYMKHINDLERSRFVGWNKFELAELLVADGIELRNENILELLPLRDLADNLFTGRPMPKKPTPPDAVELVLNNMMARRIQNGWISYLSRKRSEEEERNPQYRQSVELSRLSTKPDDDFDLNLIDAFEESEGSRDENDEDITTARDVRLSMDDIESSGTTTEAAAEVEPSVRRRTQPARSSEEDGISARTRLKLNILDVPWEKPDENTAKKYMDYVQPRKGGKGGTEFDIFRTTTGRFCCLGSLGEQLDLWEEGQVSEFGIYGAGITNYFKFLKFLYWLFFILSIVSLPPLVLNIFGPSETTAGLSELSLTTVGHLAPSASNGTVLVRIPGCSDYGLFSYQCSLDSSSLAEFYSIVDIVICVIFLIGYAWTKYFENEEEKSLDSNTVNASMYTLMVTGLPPDVTEEEIIEHFNSLVRSSYNRHSTTILKSSNVDYSIAAVSLAFDNVKEIEECINRGDIVRSKIKLVHEHRYYCTKLLNKGASDLDSQIAEARKNLMERMKEKNKELKKKLKVLEEYSKQPAKVISAFVTFNKVTAKDTVMFMYKRNLNVFRWLFSKDNLSIRGYRLKVREAPEPSTIIWENLSYSWSSRMLRRSFSTFLSLLLIVFSLVTIFCSKYLSETSGGSGSTASSSLCSDVFSSGSDAQKQDFVEKNPEQLHCYCDKMSVIQQSENSLCNTYLQNNIKSQVLQYFAAFVVILVNLMLETALKFFSSFEKHHTEDTKGESIFFRLFFLKYINSAAVFFINGNNYILHSVFKLNLPSSNNLEFSSDWFNTIGVTIILVQLSDTFFTHSAKIFQFVRHYYTLKFVKSEAGEKLALTQEAFNKFHVGSNCELAYNYAQLMSTLFVCLTFSTGIPLLYSVAMANFLFYYWVEKYLFVRFYKVPPHFNSYIGKCASSMIPLAVGLHLAMSIWVLSNQELFSTEASSTAKEVLVTSPVGQAASKSSLQSRLIGTYTFPLFVLLCIIVVYEILKFIVLKLFLSAEEYWSRVLCCCLGGRRSSQSHQAKAQYLVTYTRAVQRNLIKGLSTYNLLQNPIYKDAFAITWKFALANNTVRSVRTQKSKAQAGIDEVDAERVDLMQRTRIVENGSRKPRKNRSGQGQGRASDGSENTTNTGSSAGSVRAISYSRNREFHSTFQSEQAAAHAANVAAAAALRQATRSNAQQLPPSRLRPVPNHGQGHSYTPIPEEKQIM